MRSRSVRIVSAIVAVMALGAAAAYLVATEQRLVAGRDRLRAFDLRAHDITARLTDLRVAQQAYVAEGQALGFWTAKVATLLPEASADVDALRRLATGQAAGESLLAVSANITQLGDIDKRAREYVNGRESLMASDVVFSEGGETAADAAQQVQQARLAEHQAFDALEASSRRLEAYALGGAAGLTALITILLAFAPASARRAEFEFELESRRASESKSELEFEPRAKTDTLSLRDAAPVVRAEAPPAPEVKAPPKPVVPAKAPAVNTLTAISKTQPEAPVSSPIAAASALQSAAAICTGFGQVREAGEIKALLEQAARAIDASGLVVWLGDLTGGDLQAVVAYGYSDEVLARIKAVPRMADNAAAAAYRSGAMQVVPGSSASPLGAVVAPILAPDGCIGALTAETRHASESTDHVQALVAIFAAQLASVLAGAATAEVSSARVASA